MKWFSEGPSENVKQRQEMNLKSHEIPFDAHLTKLPACIVGNLARNMGNEAALLPGKMTAAIQQVIL